MARWTAKAGARSGACSSHHLIEPVCIQCSINYRTCDVGEPEIVIPRVRSQPAERLIHVTARRLADVPFRLLDDDSAVERIAQLVIQESRVERCSVLENRDCRDICQSLYNDDVVGIEQALLGAKEVECADCPAPKAHRKAVHRAKPMGDGPGGESRPSSVGNFQCLIDNRPSVLEAVDARALVGLNLEQFEHAHRLTGGRNELQFASGRRKHDPSGVNVDRLDAPIAQYCQQVNDVEVVDKVVCELNKGRNEESFSGHLSTSPLIN